MASSYTVYFATVLFNSHTSPNENECTHCVGSVKQAFSKGTSGRLTAACWNAQSRLYALLTWVSPAEIYDTAWHHHSVTSQSESSSLLSLTDLTVLVFLTVASPSHIVLRVHIQSHFHHFLSANTQYLLSLRVVLYLLKTLSLCGFESIRRWGNHGWEECSGEDKIL